MMAQSDLIVAIIALLACLFLATRALRGRHLQSAQLVRLGLIWGGIILGLYLIARGLNLSLR